MAQAFVQKTTATGGAGTAITTPAFSSPTVVGNQLIACSSVWNSASGNSITNTDSKTNTWSRDKTLETAQNGGFGVATISQTILAAAKAGSAHTVTTTASKASSDLQAVAAEFSGSTATIDQSTTQSAAGSTTTITATTAATTNANDLVIGCLAYASPSTNNHVLTPANVNGSQTGVNSLQVVQDGNTLTGVESSYEIISATGTQAVNWTYDSQALGGYAAVVVVYMAAAASSSAAAKFSRYPNKGPLIQNYGPRVLGFKQGIVLGADLTVALTGTGITYSAGALAPSTDVPLTGALETYAAGALAPAISLALTGTAVSYAAGTLTPSTSVPLTGTLVNYSLGTLAPSLNVTLAGTDILFNTGTLTPSTGGNVTVALTGTGIAYSVGTLGVALTAPLVGSAESYAAGTLAPATNVPLTGVAESYATGTLTPATSVPLAGSVITYATGSLTANAGGDITVALTGIDVLFSTGTLAPSGGDVAPEPPAPTGSVPGFVPGDKPKKRRKKASGPVMREGQVFGEEYPISPFAPVLKSASDGEHARQSASYRAAIAALMKELL